MAKEGKELVDGKWRYVFEDGTWMPCDPPSPAELGPVERTEQPREDGAPAAGRPPTPTEPPPTPRQYLVVSQRDQYFGGQFDAAKLQKVLNQLAADRWQLVSAVTADVSAERQEIVLFLER